MVDPSRGEIWMVDLDPVRGHEQSGKRPGLIVSVDRFNHGPAGLIVLLPLTTKNKAISWHVKVEPPEGGIKSASFIKCEDIRSVARERLSRRMGLVSPTVFDLVEDRLRILLNL